ncbi:bifunctional tetrahydrofolate synthase/dihydrofolate synthase [Alteromonas mediterranea]|uniref:Dihydrofolate synthase/folylpolyglutamate synthase n=1 Tax=Alteromonas mediterranea TaxID=314275 RepID=A0AAC8XL86_9ALTE|nr:bifunctional tetrahydrofolate synthase/dihydrofolate synthase [Alteromonas mediterranea]AFV86030.1 bifunctional folylpolyglutamate synthase/dihydrofolate synthase [Alteromonas mediterranea DE1]AGP98041.1 bifunctional folylpolyglutamate synthase/dihydrofolate synthase [Alteromonas mediterranea UM7]AGQ02300.1 bifunctional folylpolyglutamate synthase/dihydrofolate synthase [Alteromonas mediterranea UM4b]AMJ79046.1 bifunctional folylpolyglutamate synthase/dihydrofolate synthase [Alteromonas medi
MNNENNLKAGSAPNANEGTLSSNTQKSLGQWLSYLESIHPSAIDMGLDRVKAVAQSMALSLSQSLVITVAGTNGKGSTCRLLEQAMLSQGKSVAVYSSPHLTDYRERVRYNGELPPANEFVKAFEFVEKSRKETEGDPITLTYFEFGTLAAMKMMQSWEVDVVILEVGLGGRLDATNIIHPDLAIITTIDLDHQDWLGNTREKIAREKAGIMRKNGNAVVGDLFPPSSLYDVVNELQANVRWATQDFVTVVASDYSEWSWKGKNSSYASLPYPKIPLQNASTALAALEFLELLPEEQVVRDIIKNTTMPGRQETISESPLVVVDVAHNPQATAEMQNWLNRYDVSKMRIVIGMLKDKSIAETLAPLAALNADWYVASTSGPRGCEAEVLENALVNAGTTIENIETFQTVASAYQRALADYQTGELILVFGSFVTVADVLAEQN